MMNNTLGFAVGASEAWTKELQAIAVMPRPKDFRNALLSVLYLACRICQFLLPNEKVEQLAANRLTIPQDAIASLLQRLVLPAPALLESAGV
ncbi:MAG: hypothetical protein RLZZ245_3778 [Verrucomicrobiota bacterium]|jgi:hypothetical protein